MSLPPRTRRATSRRMTRSPFLSSPPPMMTRVPRRASSGICFFFFLVEKHARRIGFAGGDPDDEVRAIVRPAGAAVGSNRDRAGIGTFAADLRDGRDGSCNRRFGAILAQARHDLGG